jgi:membrane protein DedA with SNARE-associated domain
MSRMRAYVFMPLNAVGAAVWAITFASAGYLFGVAVLPVLAKAEHVRLTILGALCIVAMVIWLVRVWRARRLSRKNAAAVQQSPH